MIRIVSEAAPPRIWTKTQLGAPHSRSLGDLQAETAAELDALLPSILDKVFKGEL
jgi:hypothetical protein